jgi:hypothetical protein
VSSGASKTDLIARAAALGYAMTPRRIDDWVSLGLLDRPRRRGLGRGRGSVASWSEHQMKLLEQLVRARTTARRVKTLANLPVWLWLVWGDEYVPLRQARRALGTWAVGSAVSAESQARKAAAGALDQLGQVANQSARRRIRTLLTDALATGRLDEARLRQAAARIDVPDLDGLVQILVARYTALRQLGDIPDQTFVSARAIYRSFQSAKRVGDPGLEAAANSACLDLLTTLGFLVREGPSPTT